MISSVTPHRNIEDIKEDGKGEKKNPARDNKVGLEYRNYYAALLCFTGQLLIPNSAYNGHHLIVAVSNGIRPIAPHHDPKYRPAPIITKPKTTLMTLSAEPTLRVITASMNICLTLFPLAGNKIIHGEPEVCNLSYQTGSLTKGGLWSAVQRY